MTKLKEENLPMF